jgi:hypothetical protein
MNDAPVSATVADYKRLLQEVCDNRPSGTRGRLAVALGTNRSFVSQLVNPVYAMPIPAQHLETIFEVCHFSPADREAFLAAYDRAHPGRRDSGEPPARMRVVSFTLPDLGNVRRNQAVDAMMAEYASQLLRLVAALKD